MEIPKFLKSIFVRVRPNIEGKTGEQLVEMLKSTRDVLDQFDITVALVALTQQRRSENASLQGLNPDQGTSR